MPDHERQQAGAGPNVGFGDRTKHIEPPETKDYIGAFRIGRSPFHSTGSQR